MLVIELNERLGKKILISGGGRCNFTNLGATAANYLTQGSTHFPKSALARYTPQDFLALVERHGIAWHEKKLGQLFCDHSSKQIVHLLENECADAAVEVRTNGRVTSVTRSRDHESTTLESSDASSGLPSVARGEWEVDTSLGKFRAPSLVIATGGLSYPGLGATPFGYEVARQFGVKLVPPGPGLVPLTWAPTDHEQFGGLSGLSVDVETSIAGHPERFRENLLFTHRGLSGPAILQISNYWRPGGSIRVNLLPDRSALEVFAAHRSGGHDVKAALRGLLPERFLEKWCAQHAPARPIAQIPQPELEALSRSLHAWPVKPAGDEGYPKAEVTVGGVDTGELSSKTMECRQVPGLFFIGEVVDVTGWLGGYNFQWAWASGHAAGLAV